MWKTIIRRILILIPQLIVISAFVFVLSFIMPGDAFTGMVSDDPLFAQRMEELREIHGLNDPWYTQYWRWISGVVTSFDFGDSVLTNRPVTELIGERAGNTFRLSLLSLVFTYLIAIPLGVLAARKKGSLLDRGILLYTFIALAMPTMVLAMINVYVFGIRLGWFPFRGSVDVTLTPGSIEAFFSRIYHLFLPAITTALLGTVSIINFLRSEIVDTQNSDYVMTARSKGVPTGKVYSRHILRNSLLPVVSMFGVSIAFLLGGTIFIERIFAYPGIGTLFLDSIVQRDFSVSNTLVMMFAFFTAMGTLLGDILLTVVDPRIRIR